MFLITPSGKFERPFYLEGREITPNEIEHQISPMYKTDFITDYALKWLNEANEQKKPFFLYLPYHSAHYPLQARPEDIAKYRGTYKNGWDILRKERFDRMQELSVIPDNAKLSPPEGNRNKLRGPLIPSYTDYYTWESLNEMQKDSLDLEMAVFAAMIDRLDQNIGRVINKLEADDQLKNTIIMFLVDNGSCPFYTNKIPDVQPGPDSSYWSLRSTWANLSNTPYRQYKQSGFEGGSHTPFIISWPGIIKANTITHQPGHVIDLAPTFLEILGISYPDSIQGYPTIPLQGSSLLPIFRDEKRELPDYFISGLKNHRMFRMGDYKIVRLNGQNWELYNLAEDPTELINLAAQCPDIVQKLDSIYMSQTKSFIGNTSTVFNTHN
jgi:arylsulfatase